MEIMQKATNNKCCWMWKEKELFHTEGRIVDCEVTLKINTEVPEKTKKRTTTSTYT
jgi:hypothetical protein